MPRIRTERADGVLHVVLDSPDRGNTIDLAFAEELLAALRDRSDDDRAILLRAEGRNFCFGGDVATFASDDPAATIRQLADALHVALRELAAVEVPVVVAVQGWATGAGMSLALAGDIVLLAEGARFKTAYNALGLTADGGMTWLLPRRAPWTVAMDLLLTDRVVDAAEAGLLGLAARVLPDDTLDDEARQLAAGIAGRSRGAAVAVKRLLHQSPAVTHADQLDAETEAIAAAADTPDGREGVAAFLEKRTPRFA